MNRHKHAELMAAYATDAMTTDKPWELWEARAPRKHDWFTMKGDPCWSVDFEYRRKPKQHTIVLTTEQLKEVVMACSHVGWENEDFASAVQILSNALNGEQA